MAAPPRILDPQRRTLLRAALAEGAASERAFRKWRASVRLDDIDNPTFRVLPHLLETADRFDLQDADTLRMRGIVKHIWLKNTLRARSLREAFIALRDRGIETLLLKGAALIVRDPTLAAIRVTADYDILVRPAEARRAVAVLLDAGFDAWSARGDLFTREDFAKFHAAPFTKKLREGSVDLHWHVLPDLTDARLVDDMMAHAEPATLAGERVMLPSLADQLFLTLCRPQPWDPQEVFNRAVEAILVLRLKRGTLDWERLERLVQRNGLGWIAASMLALIRDEVEAPMPPDIVTRLWRQAGPLKRLRTRLDGTPPSTRRRVKKLLRELAETALAHEARSLPALIGRALRHPTLGMRVLAAGWRCFAGTEIERVWREAADRESSFESSSPVFVQGFSYPEEAGRWTDGDIAVLEVPVAAPISHSVRAGLSIKAYLPSGIGRFRFTVATGAGPIQRLELPDRGTPSRLILDARVVGAAAPKIVIALHLIDARSPQEVGESEDPRLLGLFFDKIVTLA